MASSDEEKAKTKNKSHEPDYTCGFLLSEFRGIYYIEDIIRVRAGASETEALQKKTAEFDGHSTAIREEMEPGSAGQNYTDNKARTLFLGWNYDGIRSTGSKTSRALAASAAAGRGQIKYLSGCRNIEDFFNEVESFPGGLHDDMVDGLSGPLTYLGEVPNLGAPIVVKKAHDRGSDWSSEEDLVPGYFSSDNARMGLRGGNFSGWNI
jgi:predicted phage terminase large subunit-like protein